MMDHMHPLHMSPLYLSEVSSTLSRIWLRKIGRIAGEYDNNGHLVVGGVEGVGKSTFMQAIALAVTVLLDKMVPLYLYVEVTEANWTSLLNLMKARFPNGDFFQSAPAFIENLSRFESSIRRLYFRRFIFSPI